MAKSQRPVGMDKFSSTLKFMFSVGNTIYEQQR